MPRKQPARALLSHSLGPKCIRKVLQLLLAHYTRLMAILHQVAAAAARSAVWENLAAALAAGDTLVLFDAALAGLPLAQRWVDAFGVRVCVPRAELELAMPVPDAVEVIGDDEWLQLIIEHDVIQHWS